MKAINPEPPGLEPTDDVHLYAKALELSQLVDARKAPIHERVLNLVYWIAMLAVLGWLAALAFDRDPPVRWVKREIINPDGRIAQGETIQLRATRTRHRLCELTKRQTLIDGAGRRFDYEPEHFDAYGPITTAPETDITGPAIPLDAAPGRGRLMTTFAWDCNVLQRALGWSIVSVVGPVEFEIVPRGR